MRERGVIEDKSKAGNRNRSAHWIPLRMKEKLMFFLISSF